MRVRSSAQWQALAALLAVLAAGCGDAPDLLILPIDVIAGEEAGAALADSLGEAFACRLEGQGLHVRRLAAGELPTQGALSPEGTGRRLGTPWVLSITLLNQQESLRVVLHLVEVADDRGTWVKALLGARSRLPEMADAMAHEIGPRLGADPGEATVPEGCEGRRDDRL